MDAWLLLYKKPAHSILPGYRRLLAGILLLCLARTIATIPVIRGGISVWVIFKFMSLYGKLDLDCKFAFMEIDIDDGYNKTTL